MKEGAAFWLVAVFVHGCRSSVAVVEPRPVADVTQREPSLRPPPDPVATSVLEALDPDIDPCADFYAFACGGWLRQTEIPPGRVQWRRGFDVAGLRVKAMLRDVLDRRGDAVADEALEAARDMYTVCLDEDGIDAVGTGPVDLLLADLQEIETHRAFMEGVAELHKLGISVLFQVVREPDPGDERIYAARVMPGEPFLPPAVWRDVWIVDPDEGDPRLASVRDAAAGVLAMVGYDGPQAVDLATGALNFERNLVMEVPPRADLRDPVGTDHRMPLEAVSSLIRPLSWRGYLREMDLPRNAPASVASPAALRASARRTAETDPRVLASWLQLRLLDALAPHLPRPLRAQVLAVRASAQADLGHEGPRWEICVSETERAFGNRLGREFVTTAFQGDEQGLVTALLHAVRDAFGNRLEEVDWMDSATRVASRRKLAALSQNVGWPDVGAWNASVLVDSASHLKNALTVRRIERARSLAKLGEPVDRMVWGVRPQAVNAYYRPGLNQIVVPAGILQPPFFDRTFPNAMNYGGLGAILGHEISHAFDDRGRRYDEQGRLRNWWTAKTEEEFERRAQCIANHYEDLEVSPGAYLDGRLVLGESIADRGGLRQAFRAWGARASRAADSDRVPGLTGDQLFFVAFAQVWCAQTTPEGDRRKADGAKHPPAWVRVNEAVASVPEFWSAFRCELATPMHPPDLCQLW